MKFGKDLIDVDETDLIRACDQESLYQNGKVFRIETFGPVLHVHLTQHVYHMFRLLGIYETDTGDRVSRYDYDDICHPWVDIPVDCLNLEIGLHTYTLEFINNVTGDSFYQYFNYTIQCDNPDKPYIYMSR